VLDEPKSCTVYVAASSWLTILLASERMNRAQTKSESSVMREPIWSSRSRSGVLGDARLNLRDS
jgi:hypothetical protein